MYIYQRPEDIKIYRYLTLDAVNAALAKLKAEKGIVLEAQATVGTAGNFVTENNGVFDIDYQLVVSKLPEDLSAAELLETVKEVLPREMASKFEAGRPCDQALTFLHRAKKSGKVNFKVDLTVVKKADGEESRLVEKDGQGAWSETFNYRFLTIEEETIKDWDQWEDVREEYLKLKNDRPDDLAIDLYRQAVENIYS